MAAPYLLLELALRGRTAEAPVEAPTSSIGYRLIGAYAIELDADGRRLGSQRLILAGTPASGDARILLDEAQLVRAVADLLPASGCLVTARGGQLEIPVLEALALRHAIPLPGHFPVEDPYQARRSGYAWERHLDLSAFLADGERRLKSLPFEALLGLAFPGTPLQRGRDLRNDDLASARRRALGSYLVFLRVMQLRGKLDARTVAARLAELKFGDADPELAELARGAALPAAELQAVPTELDGLQPGLLAFDIETRLDLEALSRAVGRRVTDETAAEALVELGSSGDFAPAPFHQVLAIALVHLDGQSGRVSLERLRVGGRTHAGGTIATEADLLAIFWRLGAGQRLASYNGKRFDLPVLLYRSLAHGLDASWYLADVRPAYTQYRHRSSTRQLDLFDRLTGGLSPGRLGDLLQTIGLPGKQDVQGSDVAALWSSGAEEAVADYCLSDAAQTFLLAIRFLQITGELDPTAATAAVQAARARFEKEPALRPVLEAGSAFFASY